MEITVLYIDKPMSLGSVGGWNAFSDIVVRFVFASFCSQQRTSDE